MFHAAARGLADALFGGSCFLCRGATSRGTLCEGCMTDLPRLPSERCPRCAMPSAGAQPCGRCLASPPRFDSTRAALVFAFPADVLVHALKYRGELALAGLAAGLLGECLDEGDRVDAIVPVPLSDARMRERGYNQAMEIARHVARARGIVLAPAICERVRDTPAQAALPFAGRAANVRGAFRCPTPVAGQTIAVLDDVMTTGATLDEVASTLKRAGAARVVNWVLARTLPMADV